MSSHLVMAGQEQPNPFQNSRFREPISGFGKSGFLDVKAEHAPLGTDKLRKEKRIIPVPYGGVHRVSAFR